MADVTRDPALVGPDGHTEPLSTFGTTPEPGDHITFGTTEENTGTWEVLRVDAADGVVHLTRVDRTAALKEDHRQRGLTDDGRPRGRP